jgi:hypothetical protein
MPRPGRRRVVPEIRAGGTTAANPKHDTTMPCRPTGSARDLPPKEGHWGLTHHYNLVSSLGLSKREARPHPQKNTEVLTLIKIPILAVT